MESTRLMHTYKIHCKYYAIQSLWYTTLKTFLKNIIWYALILILHAISDTYIACWHTNFSILWFRLFTLNLVYNLIKTTWNWCKLKKINCKYYAIHPLLTYYEFSDTSLNIECYITQIVCEQMHTCILLQPVTTDILFSAYYDLGSLLLILHTI